MEAPAIEAVGRPISAALGAVTLLRMHDQYMHDGQGPRRLGRAGAKGAWRGRGRTAHSMQNVLDVIGHDNGIIT